MKLFKAFCFPVIFCYLLSIPGSWTDAQELAFLKGDILKWTLEHPESTNRDLLKMMRGESLLAKLADSGFIRFKVFDSDKPDHDASLGLDYAYFKDITLHVFIPEDPVRHLGMALDVSSAGNIAYESKKNPYDFIDGSVSLLLFYSRGGALSLPDDQAHYLNTLEDAAAEEVTREAFLRNSAAQEAARIIRSHLSTQLYTEFSLDGGIETNQSFTRKQFYYGVHAGLDVKAWNPASALAKFNILDFPFALTRLIMGSDRQWSPRGSALPTLLTGLDQVHPQDDDPRVLLGEASDYPRFRFEAAYRTLVGTVSGHSTFFEVTFGHYREIGASQEILEASLDTWTFFSAALLLPKGMYVSYATGKLPLDLENERVFALGFHFFL